MITIKINKKFIISATGAAVFAFIIEKLFNPILEILYSIFLNIGTMFVTNFSDSVYKSISDGYSEQSSTLVLYFATIAIVAYIGSLFSDINKLHNLKQQEYNNLMKSVETATKTTTETTPTDTDQTLELTEQKLNILTQNLNDLEAQLNMHQLQLDVYTKAGKEKMQRQFAIIKIFLICAIVFIFFVYGKQIFITSRITTVTNNIEIVSPYISDDEYKQLKSDFHSIRNRADYDALKETLINIATENEIKLKE